MLLCIISNQRKKKQIRSDYSRTIEDLKDASNYTDADETYEKIFERLPHEWHQSCIIGANILAKILKTNNWNFHRQSRFVKRIEAHFNKLNRQERIFSNINKWNPADIYAIKKEHMESTVNAIERTTNIQELNAVLKDLYKKKRLLGVSLKKLKTSAGFKLMNEDSNYSPYRLIDYTLGKFFDQKDMYLVLQRELYPQRVIQLRTFSQGLTGFQGEIKGEVANHGKIGYGVMQTIFKNVNYPLPHMTSIAHRVRNEEQLLLVQMHKIAQQYATDIPQDQKEFMEVIKEQPLEWRFSKYLCLVILEALMFHGQQERDRIVTNLYMYASSQSEYSAIYGKME